MRFYTWNIMHLCVFLYPSESGITVKERHIAIYASKKFNEMAFRFDESIFFDKFWFKYSLRISDFITFFRLWLDIFKMTLWFSKIKSILADATIELLYPFILHTFEVIATRRLRLLSRFLFAWIVNVFFQIKLCAEKWQWQDEN